MKLNTTGRLIGLVSTFAVIAAYPAISQTVGVNSAVRNVVKVKADAAAAAQQAQIKQRVFQGNDITTAAASSLQIMLLDRSSLTVGPSARMRVDKFVYDPNRKTSAVTASFAKGAFRFLSGKPTQGRPGQTALNTPIASIGIRGTMVEGAVGPEAMEIARLEKNLAGLMGASDPNTASLIVLRGPGKKAVRGEKVGEISVTAGGKTVIVNVAGQAVFIPAPGAAPVGPFPLSNPAFNAFDSALRTTPQSPPTVQQQSNSANNSNSNNSSQSNSGSQSNAGNSGSSGSSGSGGSAGGGGAGGGAGGAGAGAGGAAGGVGAGVGAAGAGLGAAGIGLGVAGLAGLAAAAASSGGNNASP